MPGPGRPLYRRRPCFRSTVVLKPRGGAGGWSGPLVGLQSGHGTRRLCVPHRLVRVFLANQRSSARHGTACNPARSSSDPVG